MWNRKDCSPDLRYYKSKVCLSASWQHQVPGTGQGSARKRAAWRCSLPLSHAVLKCGGELDSRVMKVKTEKCKFFMIP